MRARFIQLIIRWYLHITIMLSGFALYVTWKMHQMRFEGGLENGTCAIRFQKKIIA